MATTVLHDVQVHFLKVNTNMVFNQPFNQVTFINLDVNTPVGASVYINDLEILGPNTTTGATGQTLEIGLNTLEINKTDFKIDFRGSTTGQLQIIYSMYKDIHHS